MREALELEGSRITCPVGDNSLSGESWHVQFAEVRCRWVVLRQVEIVFFRNLCPEVVFFRNLCPLGALAETSCLGWVHRR